MTPEQDKLVGLLFEENVAPERSEPFYFDREDFEALRAMWEEHKALQGTLAAALQGGRISNMDWIRIGRRIRPMSEPFPSTAAEVKPWMERVGKPVQDAIVEELEKILS